MLSAMSGGGDKAPVPTADSIVSPGVEKDGKDKEKKELTEVRHTPLRQFFSIDWYTAVLHVLIDIRESCLSLRLMTFSPRSILTSPLAMLREETGSERSKQPRK